MQSLSTWQHSPPAACSTLCLALQQLPAARTPLLLANQWPGLLAYL